MFVNLVHKSLDILWKNEISWRAPLLETLRLTRYCAHGGVGPVIDRSVFLKIPPRSCHPASDGGQSPLHPPTGTTPAPERSTVLPTTLLQPKRRPTPESGTLSVKNTTKVLFVLPIILVTDKTSSRTTAARIATRIHSHPRTG